MILLGIVGAVLAVVVLAVAVVLLLPVDVLFLADIQQGLRIRYRFLGKVYGEKRDPNNPIIRRVKRSIGLSSIGDLQALKDDMGSRGKVSALSETVGALIMVVDRVFWLLHRCRVSRLRVDTVSGGENAAVEYGAVCAVVYPLVGYLQNNRRLRNRDTSLSLRCEYEASSSYDVELAIRVTVFYAVRALLHAMIERVKARRSVKKEETANGTA